MGGNLKIIASAALLPLIGACIPNGARPSPQVDSPRYEERQSRPEEDEVVTLPSPPPAWQARPVSPDARQIPASSYIVQSGDTLRAIADRTGAGS